MRKLLFCILTTAALSLAAGKPPTVASVKAMSCFDLLTSLTDNEELMLANARHSVPDTLDVLIRIHEKRLPGLQNSDLVAQMLVNDRTATEEQHQQWVEDKSKTYDRVLRCRYTISALKDLQVKLEHKSK